MEIMNILDRLSMKCIPELQCMTVNMKRRRMTTMMWRRILREIGRGWIRNKLIFLLDPHKLVSGSSICLFRTSRGSVA